MQLLIYGAKSLALGIYRAIQRYAPDCHVPCFLVTNLTQNVRTLAGLPVREISGAIPELAGVPKDNCHILVATPEDQHPEIIRTIQTNGYRHYTCMDSKKESIWMEEFFSRMGIFPSLHSLPQSGERAELHIVIAQFYKDKPLKNIVRLPSWGQPVQVGAALTDVRVGATTDDTGENISEKNANYCELTALYWLWKNKLEKAETENAEYYGLAHYRRSLDITDKDLFRLKANRVDAVLPFPTLHEPDISEHHERYVSESDWQTMKRALAELHPEYAQALPYFFSQPYFYNCNLILARKQVLADYCAWLFPVLARVEELSTPKAWQRRDRYIGYLGENLMTLYFLYHRQTLNLYHTGRLMFT